MAGKLLVKINRGIKSIKSLAIPYKDVKANGSIKAPLAYNVLFKRYHQTKISLLAQPMLAFTLHTFVLFLLPH